MGLFGIKEGLRIFGNITASVLTGSADPREGAGLAAEVGSMYLKSDGVTFKKTDTGDTDWLPYSEIEGGGLLWETVNAATTLEAGKGYVVDAGSVYTLTMPASPEIGDRIGFATLANAETNIVSIAFNGANFNGGADPLNIDLNYAYFEMLYTGDAGTGWVLSNSDESGNIANVRAFIGNDSVADSAVTEFSEENIVDGGDSLMVAVNKLDIEANNVNAFIGKGEADDLPTFSELADNGLPAEYSPEYIVDDEHLMISIAKLDDALQSVSGVATAGVKWRPMAKAITADNPTGKTAGKFSDDQGEWDESKWQVGQKVLSTHGDVFGQFFEWDGTTWTAGTVLQPFEAVSVRFDFLDTPAGQQDGAAYMMNEDSDEIIKIADFDLETAASIKLNAAYVAGAGVVDGTDSIQEAVQKLDGNDADQNSVLGTAAGDTNLGNEDWNYVADDADVKTALSELDQAIADATSATAFNVTTADVDSAEVVGGYTAAGNVGAKFLVFAWDGAGNRYACEIYCMNTASAVDFTEYAILNIGTADIEFSLAVVGGEVELTATPGSGTYTVKTQRVLISE